MEFESVADAARRYGVTPRTVQKWIKSGKLHGAVLVGNSYAIPVSSTTAQASPSISPRRYTPFPIINGSFSPGESKKYIKSIPDDVLRENARAEQLYFSGQCREAVDILEKYIEHADDAISMSASILYTFASMAIGKTHQAEIGLRSIRRTVIRVLEHSENKSLRANAVFVATSQAVLLHKPIPDIPMLRTVMCDLPEGTRQFAAYILAHKAYLSKNYERTLAICDTVMHYTTELCPVPAIHLLLIGSIALLNMKRTEEAKEYFMRAYNIAAPEDYIEPFAENYMLLGGLAEICLKRDNPEAFRRLIEITNSYKSAWSRVHNREMNNTVTSVLSHTEFTVAMLYNQGWSAKEIAAHMELSERMVKYYVSMIYDKLGISSREELWQFMIN